MKIFYLIYLHSYSEASLFYNFIVQCYLAYLWMCFILLFYYTPFHIWKIISYFGNPRLTEYFRARENNAAKMTVKKWNAKDRKCVVTERKCSCNDAGDSFYYISRVIIIHYAMWSDNMSIFMSWFNTYEKNACNKLNNWGQENISFKFHFFIYL